MTILGLWLPIIVSAVVVFVAGSVIWMAMPSLRGSSTTSDQEHALTSLVFDPARLLVETDRPTAASHRGEVAERTFRVSSGWVSGYASAAIAC